MKDTILVAMEVIMMVDMILIKGYNKLNKNI
jgi:hypothetical protein